MLISRTRTHALPLTQPPPAHDSTSALDGLLSVHAAPLAPASERRGLRNGRRRASASSAPPLPPCLLRIRLSSARLTSHRSPASLCRSWQLAFFSVAGYACEEGGGAAARGSKCSGVRPTVPHLSCAQVPCPRDRVLGSRLQRRRGITNNASAHRGSAYKSGRRGGSRKQGLFGEHKDRTYLCRYLDSRQLSTKYNLCIQKNQSGMVNLATNYLFLIQFLLYKGVNYYCYSLHVH